MGVLRNTAFWSSVLNELAPLQPPLGERISKENAARIREISCAALTTLLEDPEFPQDMKHVFGHSESGKVIDAPGVLNFSAFLDSFMLLENKILDDAGINSVASRELEREIRRIAIEPASLRFERLEDKISYLRKLACDPSVADDKKVPLWLAVWRGVNGVGLIGIDVGIGVGGAVILGPGGAAAVGQVAGISMSYGAALVFDAVKDRW